MAVYSHQPYAPPPSTGLPVPGVLRRPLTSTLAFVGALVVGLFSVVAAALLIMNAHDLAAQTADAAVSSAGLTGSDLAQSVIDDAASTLVVRGVMGLVSGVLVLGFALAARNAATWARVVLTLLLVSGICANGLAARDVAPTASKALDLMAIVLSLAVVVLMFLPPTNRFAKARKQGIA